jgi:hypothetical protein
VKRTTKQGRSTETLKLSQRLIRPQLDTSSTQVATIPFRKPRRKTIQETSMEISSQKKISTSTIRASQRKMPSNTGVITKSNKTTRRIVTKTSTEQGGRSQKGTPGEQMKGKRSMEANTRMNMATQNKKQSTVEGTLTRRRSSIKT